MRRLLNIFIAVGLMMPLFGVTVYAQSATTTDGSSQKTLEQRVADYKANFKQSLSKAQQTTLKAKCKASQGLVSSLSGRVKGIETSRGEVYKHVTDKLASLQVKLQNKDVDTTELQAGIATLQTKISTYKTDLDAYKQDLADLSAMDCVSDPTAFKSALEATRAARLKVATDSTDIHTYVKDTIKPMLAKIREGLNKTETNGQ